MAYTRDYLLTYGSVQVASVAAGTGVYTMTADNLAAGFGNPIDWIKVGIQIRIYGCANGANNGIFTVTNVAGSVITTSNTASVLENPATNGRAGYPVGGISDNILTDISTQQIDSATAQVKFKFEVADQVEATFNAKVLSAESVFRTPRRDFSWLNGVSPILTLGNADASGFDAEPTIEKPEEKGQTGRSRVFQVTLKFGVAADVLHNGGQRIAEVNVSYSPSRRRRITISGMYTRVPPGTTTARAQYEANIDAYALVVLTALGLGASTAELGEEPSTVHNVTNSTLSFTRVYDEIIFGQGGGANDSAIVRQSLKVSRKKIAPGDTPSANRLATLSVSYDAWIDKSVTDLRGKYDSIRNWIVQIARATLSGGVAALVDDTPEFDFDDNRIHANLTLMCSTGGNVFENSTTTETYDEFGGVLRPVWDGNSLSKYDYQGPARKLKTITHVWKELGLGDTGGQGSSSTGMGMNVQFGQGSGIGVGVSGGFSFPGGGSINIFGPASGQATSDLAAAAQGLPTSGGGGGGPGVQADGGLPMIPVSWRNSSTPKTMGLDGYTIDYVEHVSVQVFEYFAKPSGGGGGGAPPVASGQGQSGFGLGGS